MAKLASVLITAEPYTIELDLSKTALLVIDMQNDFCSPGGFGERLGNDITPTREIIPNIQELQHCFRKEGGLVIHTREGHLPDLSDCPPSKQKRSKKQGAGIGDVGSLGRILIRGEKGHDIIDELYPLSKEIIIDKPGKGAFYKTELEQVLEDNDIESLIITGVTTHVCVHSTLREANDRGYECIVVKDGTAAFDRSDHEDAIRMVHQQGGIFGWVCSTASITDSILEAAK